MVLSNELKVINKKLDVIAEAVTIGNSKVVLSDPEAMAELERLRHHKDTTVGLWAMDNDPALVVDYYVNDGHIDEAQRGVLDEFVKHLKAVEFFQIKDPIKKPEESQFMRKQPSGEDLPGLIPGVEEVIIPGDLNKDLSAEASAQAEQAGKEKESNDQ